MEQRLVIRHMMKTLKNVVLENRKFDYTIYKTSSMIELVASQLSVLCKDDVTNLEFDMGIDIIRSNYTITILCGSAHQGKNAVIIEDLKTSKTICGQIIDKNKERGTYNTTIEICDAIIRRDKKGNNVSAVTIKGSVATVADLADLKGMVVGDGYIVEADGHLHVFNGVDFTDKDDVKKYKTAYEKAVKEGFTGSERDFLTSARVSPLAMNLMPLASIDCNTFEQICEYNPKSESTPEPSLYSKMYQDMVDSIDVGTYTNKLSNLFDMNCLGNMSKLLDSLMPILEKSGLIESISNADELANLVRGAFYEYKYNADSILNFNIETGSIDSFLHRVPMLKLILELEDKIEELKESGRKFDAQSFITRMYNILLRLKMSSYLLNREDVQFEINITQERSIQLFDVTSGHEKLLLFSADVSGILEDEDYNIRPFIPLTGISDKIEDELVTFTLVMSQNQIFLSKFVEVEMLSSGDWIIEPPSLEETIDKNNNQYVRRDDLPAFDITLLQDIQLDENEIKKRYNQIMNDDSEDDDNK